MQDKKVRISVEDSKLKDLGRTATELANDMIKSSRQYSTSSKEVLKDLEDQIKLIEKRYQLELEGRKRVINEEKNLINQSRHQDIAQARKIEDPKSRREAIKETQTLYSEGQSRVGGMQSHLNKLIDETKKQTAAIREEIDAIKQTSKNEIREDRIGVEKSLRGDKSINRLGVEGDPQEALKRTIQQGLIGDLGEEETEQRGKFKAFGKFGKDGGRAFNTAANIGTSKNELYALAGLVGLTPFIGQGASQVANRFLSAGETAETSMSSWGFANLGKKEGFDTEWNKIKEDSRASALGLSPSDVLNRKAELKRTIGKDFSGDIYETMGAEKFVGQGNISQLASTSRYGQGDITKVLRVLEAGNKSTTRLTEDIGTYVQASNQALNISSSVDEAKLARTVVGVSEATGMEGRNLGQVTGAIQGLGQTSNPIVKSMMMRSFRQENPNASLFDIQAMMEDPLANIDKGGGKFFENMKEMSGGGDMYKQVLYSIFGGNLSRTKIGEILKDGGDFTEIAKESQLVEESSIKFAPEAETKTGIGAKATATADAEFQKLGRETLEASANIVETVKELFDKMNSSNETNKEAKTVLEDILKSNVKYQDTSVENYIKSETFMSKVLNFLLMSESFNPNTP